MSVVSKANIKKMFNALVVTMAFAAMCHMTLVTVMAIIKRSISYINPLDFLGVSILLPEYRESRAVAAVGWVVLVSLFFVILYIRARYHVYATIMNDKVYERIQKLALRTQALRLRSRSQKLRDTLQKPVDTAWWDD